MHIAVLQEEIKNIIKSSHPRTSLDFTFGAGGHSKIILENSDSKLIAMDRDTSTEKFALPLLEAYGDRFKFYMDISSHMHLYTTSVDFILGDLGLSQMQLKEHRGFSYKYDSPLDMQMGLHSKGSLHSFIRTLSEYKLGEILREYGEEPQWRRIANLIHEERNSIHTTFHLKEVILQVVKYNTNQALSRCFQAFRIFINEELSILRTTLQGAYDLLNDGGKLAIITFDSLHDRTVKTFFNKKLHNTQLLRPTEKEVINNSQSRSAILRIGTKIQ